MRAANATELYLFMWDDVDKSVTRVAVDGAQHKETWEAPLMQCYTLINPTHNLVGCRQIDERWAWASTLHFFASTERAGPLLRYNKHAERFLAFTLRCADGRVGHLSDSVCQVCGDFGEKHSAEYMWLGAYGAHAMPQINRCIEKLKAYPTSRRAVVNMAGLDIEDINRPHCWTALQFLQCRGELELLVFQRSLSLSVMPYDLVNLTNILHYVAHAVGMPTGALHWAVGSLHCVPIEAPMEHNPRHRGLLLDPIILADPARCYRELERE